MKMNDASMEIETLIIGKIQGSYGVKGWLRVLPYAGDDSSLHTIKRWYLQGKAGFVDERLCLGARWHNGAVLAQLEGIATKEAADALKGVEVAVSKMALPKPQAGEYYWLDLIGCTVLDANGAPLGVVQDVSSNGAQSILEVIAPTIKAGDTAPQSWLIPFVPAFIGDIDLNAKTIASQWLADY